jgi:hypothetical protein
VARSPRSYSNSTPACYDPGADYVGTVSAFSPRPDEKSETAPDRGEASHERFGPVEQFHLQRTVAALTQLAQHFKRLRDRTDSSPPPGSPSSGSET